MENKKYTYRRSTDKIKRPAHIGGYNYEPFWGIYDENGKLVARFEHRDDALAKCFRMNGKKLYQ